MRTEVAPHPIFLKDYSQPDYWIPKTELKFVLGDDTRGEKTYVHSKLKLERNASKPVAPLVLNGEGFRLVSLAVDGKYLQSSEYVITDSTLTISQLPNECMLEVVTELEPEKNLSCEGLYKSGGAEKGMFCTQCEAESFRKITYFLDRPDVMSVYTVTIEADKAKFPILLSNGNPVATRDLADGRHEAIWHDPHRKPCYLFALVAGDMGVLEDKFITRSGREVALKIFCRKGLEDRCTHAMESLKWSMKWDEDTYGLEYDLDIFMIVVAEDFNMGAMENKGLNVFNASYVLAKQETATDHDFEGVMSVVAHEYFHNWTGNRVTCRDWFQLSLKEGLTVFRDQRFTSDMTSEAVNRIDHIIRLRTHQFVEDAGPMAHPIRPSSYISINNFYTMTVYEKGSEVIRMMQTMLGRDGFRKGMDLYFKRHDGHAVTTEDFVAAMADANQFDFTQFKNWYDQAGTPTIKVQTKYDTSAKTYEVSIEQSCPPSPGQEVKKPYHIPVAIGLLGADGNDLNLQLEASGANGATELSAGNKTTLVLHVRKPKETFKFVGVQERPVLSLLRGFSAPVRAEYDYSDADLAFIIAHDSDAFCRWEAAQTLTVRVAKALVAEYKNGTRLAEPKIFTDAFKPLLNDASVDPAFISTMLGLPAEQYLAQFFTTVDVDAIHAVRLHLMKALAVAHRDWLETKYVELVKIGTEGTDPKKAALRALKNRVLEYLVLDGDLKNIARAVEQRETAKNMTEELGALEALNHTPSPDRQRAMQAFYEKWKNESLVMNKWFSLEALNTQPNCLDRIRDLSSDPVFDKNNPNKIYSLYAAFARFNQVRFHDKSGEGYRFIADQILDVDSRNPQVAARLMAGFNQWRTLELARQALIKTELTRILAKPGLSSNVYEIASKALKG